MCAVAGPAARPARAGADGCTPPDSGTHDVRVDGRDRGYEVSAPDAELTPAPWPLVIALHGTGGSASHFGNSSGLAAEGAAAGALMVLPDGTGEPTGWVHADRDRDLAFVDAVIDEVVASGCVDRDRLWVTGVSAGSAMAAAMVCHRPDVDGAVLVAALRQPCDAVGADIYVVHGTADDIVPYAGGDFNGVELGSIPDTAAGWGAAAGCDPSLAGRGVVPDVYVLEWSACDHGGAADGVVVLYSVIGGPHGWFTDGEAAVDATCLVVTAATADDDVVADPSPCEG